MVAEAQIKSQSKNSAKEFEKLLNEDFKDRKIKENQIIQATVTEITKNFIVVDCKCKMEGMIPIEEFKKNNELDKLKVGSKIEIYLERIENFKGELIISRDKARRLNAYKKMEKYFETKEELVGYIVGRVKGGYICEVDGCPTFMPASQIDVRPLKRVDHLLNVPVKVIATRIDKVRGNICTSRRAVLELSKDAEVKEVLKNLKEGDIVENAKCKAITDWGIFLDINGIDALLHVSDLSHGRVKKTSEMVSIGDTLKVKITKIDPKTNRVSASIKALTEDPYESVTKNYEIGKIYDGVCTKIMQYGIFVRLQEGVEGLIHSSMLSWTNKNVEPSKILSVSQTIKVKIISIDVQSKRISLSYKDTLENPWKKVEESLNTIVSVKVKSIADKYLLAELDNGLSGMLFYKEISFNEDIEDLKKYKKNQIIKAKIIEVKDEKIKLSVRALEKDPIDWFRENKKQVGDVITTTVQEVMKSGVKVSVGNDKRFLVMIKKSQLAKESSDQRPEIFQNGNKLDAAITDLNLAERKVSLSVKQAQIEEEKSLVKKFGKDAKSSGATLKDIFNKALNITKKKDNKKKKN
ncbi:MAG: S1 RNA-binding domain-containing protein [Pelagibacteraceae bacterium]